MIRALVAFACFIAAALLLFIAIRPVINGADLLFWALLGLGYWLLRPIREDIPPNHADALGSLDIRDLERRHSDI